MESQVVVVSVPPWVDHEPYDPGLELDDAFVNGGLCHLLHESQIDVTEPTPGYHARHAWRVITQAGAERVAQISISFDPSFQRLDVHFIRVRRGDRVIDHAQSGAFDLLRREQNLERRVLNGELTAALIVPDVHPGDILELCWTIYGQNPALCGRYFNWVGIEEQIPCLAIRHRLRAPASRAISARTFGPIPAPSVSEHDGIVDRKWSAEKCRMPEREPYMPPWQILANSIQFSESPSWESVAELFTCQYQSDPIPEQIAQEARRISMHLPPEQCALEILCFVQRRIRYLALALGESGLVPRPLDQIWESGYGDCKDTARLYTAMAKVAGIDAAPALVSTVYGPALSGWLPSATVFNHCIVRVRIGTKTRWLDTTQRAQAGSIDLIHKPLFGWALPLTDQTDALERMEVFEPILTASAHERITFGPRVDAPAEFVAEVTYRSGTAERARNQIANQGLTNFSASYKKPFEKDWPTLEEKDPLRVEDEPEKNQLTVVTAFRIAKPWNSAGPKRVSCQLNDHVLARVLGPLQRRPRRHDIFLGSPQVLKREITIDLPRNWNVTPRAFHRAIPGLKYTSTLYARGARCVVQEQELTVSEPLTTAVNAEGYSDIVEAMNRDSSLTLSSSISGNRFVERQGRWPSWRIAIVAIWLLFMLLSFLGSLAGR